MGLAQDFVKLTPTVAEKPPNETSKYGTCENSEEQDFIQASLV